MTTRIISRSKAPYAGFTAEQHEIAMRGHRRDEARKQRIVARSPHLRWAADARATDEMSSRELAARELRELGIAVDDRSVEEQILDGVHAGRAQARGRRTGSASDAAESGAAAAIRKMMQGE